MAVIHPFISITTDFTSEPIILRDVTAKAIGRYYFTTGTYRDLPRMTFGKVSASMGTGLVPAITDIPVIGAGDAPQQTSAATFSRTRMVSSDDALHIPPRPLDHWETCYFFAYNEAVIPPAPSILAPSTCNFTAAVTGSVITALGNDLANQDKVLLVTTGTLPGGLSLAESYTVTKITGNTLRLVNSAGVPVAITNTGTGTHTLVLITRAVPPTPPNVDDVDIIPFAWNPQISYPETA